MARSLGDHKQNTKANHFSRSLYRSAMGYVYWVGTIQQKDGWKNGF